MRKNTMDTVLRVRVRHVPGQLARLAQAVADQAALMGDIRTVGMQEEFTTRDVTVETDDETHLKKVIAAVNALAGIDVLSITDRVFECHRGGKIESKSRVSLKHLADLRYVYTPGVARVALAIKQDPDQAFDYTSIGNSVGIFTNGTRVLGLGDIGPLASLPVMEGKAVLYDQFAGISATPILVNSTDPEEFIETVMRVAPSFGGIHLEDIRIPDCFRIENELKRRLNKPVMHDDQHGTATVALSAVINACRLTGTKLHDAHVGQIGLGAAGSAIARLVMAFGVRQVSVADRSTEAVASLVSAGASASDLATVMRDCDIVIAATGRKGLITPEMVRKGQVIFALSNPDAEIDPDTALKAGAAFASDGRSINNALAFPGLFKGALLARSRSITQEMMVVAAETIAAKAAADELVPHPLKADVHQAVTHAVRTKALAQGLERTARPI